MLKRLVSIRRMHAHGGDHHGHGHHAEAEFLGGKNRKRDGSEFLLKVFVVLAIGGTVLARAYSPDTSLSSWARDEAEERIRRKEAGLEVKFGKNYFQERLRDEVSERYSKKKD